MHILFYRNLIAAFAAIVAIVSMVMLPTPVRATDLGGFYAPPLPLASYCLNDGDVIKDEPSNFVLPTQTPYSARRIMYCSRDTNGARMAVTGTVITPVLPWIGSGPRPIIGFAVGTQGMGDQCAPSYQVSTASPMEYEVTAIATLLTAGYGVTIPDYQAMGTPGVPSYLNRNALGHAVLDSIRAAQRLTSAFLPAAGPVAFWGYSEGGMASGAAAELQTSYAPDLQLKGAYVGAAPANLQLLAQYLDGKPAAGVLLYMLDSMNAAYPKAGFLDMLNAAGQQVASQALNECWDQTLVQHALLQTSTLTNDGRPIPAHLAEQPLASPVNQQQLGLVPPTVPVFVVHSQFDDIVPYQAGHDMAVSWCNRGATVQFTALTAPTHLAALLASIPLALAYIQNRFAGLPAPYNCGNF
ncbi:lipase family protein [Cupriavidus sp. IDO]|uniref:lipase family protein n=1 Tax=Cupriavidus sp. IDO TaxID=1539142 RepID=UPI000578E497|nr:lipase family protein [Cupriavidus sp. IDO]